MYRTHKRQNCKYFYVISKIFFVSKSSTDIGRTKLVKHQIDTGNSKPIRQPPTRIPFAKRAEVRQKLEDMKKMGVISY